MMKFLSDLRECLRCSSFTHRNIKRFFLSPIRYVFSHNKKNMLGSIGVVMCVWDEEDNILDALKSSFKYVDKYYIIDKNGRMEKLVKDFFSFHNVSYHYEVCSDLNLLESRKYAVSLVKEKWVLIQDGDEIMLHPKLLKSMMCFDNVCYQTRMVVTKGIDTYIQSYHNFFFVNNGLCYFQYRRDVPCYKGRYIKINYIMKENRTYNKSDDRLYIKENIWYEYQYSGFKGSIEDYIKKVGFK